MKCPKCCKEMSFSVLPLHIKRCNVEEKKEAERKEPVKVQKNEAIEVVSNCEFTLEELIQKCIEDESVQYAPSTIKRWKKARCRKELNI